MQENAVLAGVSAGIARFLRDFDQPLPPLDELDALRKEASDRAWRIAENKQEWHPRGVMLLAEILTIGTLSRWAFGEEPLTDEQAFRFVGDFEAMINSFFHLQLP